MANKDQGTNQVLFFYSIKHVFKNLGSLDWRKAFEKVYSLYRNTMYLYFGFWPFSHTKTLDNFVLLPWGPPKNNNKKDGIIRYFKENAKKIRNFMVIFFVWLPRQKVKKSIPHRFKNRYEDVI